MILILTWLNIVFKVIFLLLKCFVKFVELIFEIIWIFFLIILVFVLFDLIFLLIVLVSSFVLKGSSRYVHIILMIDLINVFRFVSFIIYEIMKCLFMVRVCSNDCLLKKLLGSFFISCRPLIDCMFM